MTTRRSFLSALAALPVVGKMLGGSGDARSRTGPPRFFAKRGVEIQPYYQSGPCLKNEWLVSADLDLDDVDVGWTYEQIPVDYP